MTDPLLCLRNSTIGIAIWNIIYAIIQMAIMGWQTKEVKDRQWAFENRQLPATGAIDGFQARFPGLYQIYTETPERRRINAMYVIVLINIVLAIAHFFTSVALLYGAIKYLKNYILPWFFTAGPLIIMSTAYAVLWWSGDVFGEQLTMSVAEFVMSLAINGICFAVVVFFYFRMSGQLTSDKPARHHRRSRRHDRERPLVLEIPYSSDPKSPLHVYPARTRPRNNSADRPRHRANSAPPWRTDWPELPDVQLQRKIRRDRRRSRSPRVAGIQNNGDGSLDFYAPDAYDRGFPWKMQKLKRGDPPKPTAHETIERLYYANNPGEVPGIPHGMRSSLRKATSRGRSPDRVTWSRHDPSIHYRTPSEVTPQKASVI